MNIQLQNVEVERAGEKRLTELTYTFWPGVTYIAGANGSGKSTLLQLIATALMPTNGTIQYKQGNTLSIEEVRTMIGYLPQEFTGYPDMTIERYLTYMAFHKGIPRKLVKSTLEKWLTTTGLDKIKRRKLRALSGGQLKKVGWIQALMNYPRICLLDEPFEGLDIEERLYFQKEIQRLSFHSIVIISTHILEERQGGVTLYLREGRQVDEKMAFLGNETFLAKYCK